MRYICGYVLQSNTRFINCGIFNQFLLILKLYQKLYQFLLILKIFYQFLLNPQTFQFVFLLPLLSTNQLILVKTWITDAETDMTLTKTHLCLWPILFQSLCDSGENFFFYIGLKRLCLFARSWTYYSTWPCKPAFTVRPGKPNVNCKTGLCRRHVCMYVITC